MQKIKRWIRTRRTRRRRSSGSGNGNVIMCIFMLPSTVGGGVMQIVIGLVNEKDDKETLITFCGLIRSDPCVCVLLTFHFQTPVMYHMLDCMLPDGIHKMLNHITYEYVLVKCMNVRHTNN